MRSLIQIAPTVEYIEEDLAVLKSVYVVDDDAVARRATFHFLSDLNFVPRPFQSVEDFLEDVDHLQPGCLLLGNPGDGQDTSRLIQGLGDRAQEFPIIITTSHGDVSTAVQAMKLGATDVLELPFGRHVLPEMLGSILACLGQRLSRIRAARSSRSLVEALTARERAVLRDLLHGASNKEIARHLNVSLRTVEAHRASMMRRLRAKHLSDALRIAFEAETTNV